MSRRLEDRLINACAIRLGLIVGMVVGIAVGNTFSLIWEFGFILVQVMIFLWFTFRDVKHVEDQKPIYDRRKNQDTV